MSDYVSNRPVIREFNNQGQALLRRADRYFVERKDDGGWEVTQPADRFVSADELGSKFGLWQDKEITEGHLWWKKTVRAKDGVIDQDEVIPMGQVMSTHHDSFVGYPYPNHTYRTYDNLLATDTTLQLKTDGGTLHTDWTTQSRHITQNDWGTSYNRYLAD